MEFVSAQIEAKNKEQTTGGETRGKTTGIPVDCRTMQIFCEYAKGICTIHREC